MGLFRRRPPRQEYAVSVEGLWGALKAALPSVTSQVTFYEEAHRVEWTTDPVGVRLAGAPERTRGSLG
jgi:hypothetical protein